MGRLTSAVLTTILHVAVVLAAVTSCQERKPPPPANKPLILVNVKDPGRIEYIRSAKNGDYPCERTYDGIGLAGIDNNGVWDVLEDGPAYRAGIREGDILTGIDAFTVGSLPIGAWVVVQKKMLNGWKTIRIKVETICRK